MFILCLSNVLLDVVEHSSCPSLHTEVHTIASSGEIKCCEKVWYWCSFDTCCQGLENFGNICVLQSPLLVSVNNYGENTYKCSLQPIYKCCNFNNMLVMCMYTYRGLLSHGANDKHFKGNLIAYMGDTPAANQAGGFKVSVGGAYSCKLRDQVFKSLFTGKLNWPLAYWIWLSSFVYFLFFQLKCEHLRPRWLNQHLRHCSCCYWWSFIF